MPLPAFVELLEEASWNPRRYEAGQSMKTMCQSAIRSYSKAYPEHDWSAHFREIREGWSNPDPNGEDILGIYETRAMVRWGASDTSFIQKKLGVTLPDWMLEFYANVVRAFLPMLNQIIVLGVEESVAYELRRREALGETGPCRMIRFAEGDPTGMGFSIYQSLVDQQWRVIKTNYFEGPTPKVVEDEWPMSLSDRDINEWLARMMRTNGHPIIIGNEEYEPMGWRRVDGEAAVE